VVTGTPISTTVEDLSGQLRFLGLREMENQHFWEPFQRSRSRYKARTVARAALLYCPVCVQLFAAIHGHGYANGVPGADDAT